LLRLIGLETERETAFEGLSVAFGNEFIPGGTTLLLRALRGQQVTEARRTTHELTGRGELEALSHGLFGLLHGEKRRKQTSDRQL